MSDSIRYEWRRTVNRDHRLTHADRRVLFELESYANPDGTNAHPGVELIAENLLTDERTPMSEKTVRRALKRAQELGYIEQTAKARRAGDVWLAAVWRLVLAVDSAEASPDTQMSGHPVDNASITGHFESDHRTFSDHHRTSGCPDTSSFNTSSINTIEIRSVRASADHADASANGGETELPDTWSPGKFHRSAAEKLHMDVETLADDFRATMVGEKRGDWGSTFGAYIKERSTDRADVTFPDPGTDEDPFAPVATSTVVTLPDTTAAAIEWVTPALWEVGINPDTLTSDERADVVFGQDSGDPHDVARRIVDARTERHLTNVRKHIGGSLSAEERAFVATCVENGYDSPDDLAADIRNARKGRAVIRNAGGDPVGKSVRELADQYLECIEDEDGEPRSGDPVDHYRALLSA